MALQVVCAPPPPTHTHTHPGPGCRPTSGLDSDMALQVVTHLHKLAHELNRMVVFTIHQPNGDITELFDDLLLLAPGAILRGCVRACAPGDWVGWGGITELLDHLSCFWHQVWGVSCCRAAGCLICGCWWLLDAGTCPVPLCCWDPPGPDVCPPPPHPPWWCIHAGGRPVYSGPWQGALPHFASLGYDCPLYKNPAGEVAARWRSCCWLHAAAARCGAHGVAVWGGDGGAELAAAAC